MKKTKAKILVFILFVVIIALSIFLFIKHNNYVNSYEYKFLSKGYNKEEKSYLLNLDKDKKDYLLSIDYNDGIVNILKEKYFMWKNIDRYILFYNNHKDKSFSDIISIVNVNADKNWYDETIVKETDISIPETMLVNKFHHLPSNYDENLNISSIKNWYTFGERKIIDYVYAAFIKMYDAAKEEGLDLIINSGFRTNEEQYKLYNDRKSKYGEEYADKYAARPLFSEHETGLALDIFTYKYRTTSSFEKSPEYEWLINNSYKYGFILRYPKDKEYLTGYSYESWHYRYLGIDLAKKVYESGLTYDEYYAYYIEK